MKKLCIHRVNVNYFKADRILSSTSQLLNNTMTNKILQVQQNILVLQQLLSSIVMQNIQEFYGGAMFVVTCYSIVSSQET